MRSSSRFALSLAFGGLLLAASPTNRAALAEGAAAQQEPASATPAPATPAPAAPAPPAPAMPEPEPVPAAAPGSAYGPIQQVESVQATPDEKRFLELANQERARRGLGTLVFDPLLTAVARLHSAEMRDRSYFNHNSPTAAIKTPMDRYLKAMASKPVYACVGENLFYCSIEDVNRGHQAFMNSPTHRENLLFPRFEKMGVGIVKNAKGEFWVTEMFLTNTDPTSIAKRVSSSRR